MMDVNCHFITLRVRLVRKEPGAKNVALKGVSTQAKLLHFWILTECLAIYLLD